MDRRFLTVLLLGFSSGLPLALTGGTLQAWMTDAKTDLTTIGIFSLVGLPYSFKFLWAPLLDRFNMPLLANLGRRRSWMLTWQFLLVAAIAWMGFCNPSTQAPLLATAALCVVFLSASQDITIDAYRTEVLDDKSRGRGSSLSVLGYRLAMIVSGALALRLADTGTSWQNVYLLMAACMGVGIATSFFTKEPEITAPPPRSLEEAVLAPLGNFFRRKGAIEVVLFVFLYKLDVVLATGLLTPFLMKIGYTKTQIGDVTKVFGLIATILGTLSGGFILDKIGLKRALWLFGILQGLATLSLLAIAITGSTDIWMLTTAIGLENFLSGMGNAAYAAFLMRLCDKRFTATQFALLSSIMAATRTAATSVTGVLADNLGWVNYFIVAMLSAIPGLLMLLRYDSWDAPSDAGEKENKAS